MNPTEDGGSSEEVTLASKVLEHAGKTYFLDHKQNRRGHYVKLVEARAGRRVTVILPTEVLVDVATFVGRSAQRAGVLQLSSPRPS